MHYKAKYIYIGIDTHKYTHTAVIINCWQEKLADLTFENKPSAYNSLLEEVKKHIKRGIKPIFGLEDVGGVGRALAVFLLQNKKIVKEVNPALTSVERKSRPTIHKTDSFDGLCIARTLFSKFEELPDANPQDRYWALSQLVTRREGMVKSLVAVKCQLHTQLSYNYPSYHKFFSELDGKTALEFWEKYPSPAKLKEADIDEINELLFSTSHNFFTINKAKEILEMVEADGITEVKEHQEIRDFLVVSLVKEIKYKEQEMKKVEAELKTLVDSFGYKLHTMNGIDIVVTAKLIAEIGDINRFPTADKLAKHAGVAPITYSSGLKETNLKSRQGNRNLYTTFHLLALHQTLLNRNTNDPRNSIFHDYYIKKISEGKTKGQALVCVMRRLVNIVYGMMKNKTEYISKPFQLKR